MLLWRFPLTCRLQELILTALKVMWFFIVFAYLKVLKTMTGKSAYSASTGELLLLTYDLKHRNWWLDYSGIRKIWDAVYGTQIHQLIFTLRRIIKKTIFLDPDCYYASVILISYCYKAQKHKFKTWITCKRKEFGSFDHCKLFWL